MKAAWLGVFVIALAAGSGCSDKKVTAPNPPSAGIGQPPAPFIHPPPGIPNLTVAQLLAAPDSLRLADTTTAIPVSVILWRDYFSDHVSGSPMYAVALFSPPYSDPTDAYLWVIRDSSDVWSTTMRFQFIEYPTNDYNYYAYNYYASGGPKWGPGAYVDVVIGVRRSPTDVRLVLLRHVWIGATS